MKQVYIKTFGCQMNVYDSSRMIDLLKQDNYSLVEEPKDADIIIFNTCHIREKASEKIFSEIGKLRKLKENKINKGGYCIIVIAGCVAKAEGENIIKRSKLVDIVISPGSYHLLLEKINEVLKNLKKKERFYTVNLEDNSQERFDALPIERSVKGVSELITIQSGCDKFCSYCVVPYTRGREYSRPVDAIIQEAKLLANNNIKEITLLGQNVDNFNGLDSNNEKSNLAKLIYEIHKLDGIERIRYLTSYPSQFTDELVLAHKDLPKLMPFIHLPVQSGSNKILKSMNRKYTREQYLELIEKLRISVPNVAISSDFIVGFAGEEDEDFEETVALVKQVNYASSFSFKYSPRPNTVGIKMKNQIPEKIKQARLAVLQGILDEQQINFNLAFKNKVLSVLIENTSQRAGCETVFGRSPYLQAVILNCKDCSQNTKENLIGKIVDVKINDANLRTLSGELLE